MTERTWLPGVSGDWLNPANWTPSGVPADGDTLEVASGSPTIADVAIAGETILLGGPVTLELDNVTFAPGVTGPSHVIVRGGSHVVPTDVTVVNLGTTHFNGQLLVETVGGGMLAIELEDTGPTAGFLLDDKGFLLVNQESLLVLTGRAFTNDGVIHIEGRAHLESGLNVDGDGKFEIDAGGHLVVEGVVGEDQTVVFGGGTGDLTLAAPLDFAATVAFTQYGGDRIHLDGTKARSGEVVDGVLTLYSGKNQTGEVVATFGVELVNPADFLPLPAADQTLDGKDFAFDGDGQGGTLVTYAPRGPTYQEGSLPVPVISDTGSLVSLAKIFKQSFGTKNPDFFGITLLPSTSQDRPDYFWGQPDINGIDPALSAWIVNGSAIDAPYTVKPGDVVALRVGNGISFPPQIEVRLTEAASGEKAEYLTYDVWTVDPAVADLIHGGKFKPGAPLPADIVASAEAYQAVYAEVLNSNLCDWIADNVAAAAGATMPLPDAYLDPSLNVPGGFWRVAYRGSDTDTPVDDWNSLVRPGDIVRLEWAATATGHTTTVLAVNNDGSIEVYDNDDIVEGQHKIAAHTIGTDDVLGYWTKTDPAGITIYRLDPDQQYLIEGTPLGEVLQGTVFDDLIRGRKGDDNLRGSIGDDVLRGGKGGDLLRGGKGDDIVSGARGSDTLRGGKGDDVLAGGRHDDILRGDRGADVFEYARLADSRPGHGHRDIIRDFVAGEDQIDLSAIGARIVAQGGKPLHFVGGAPVEGHAGAVGYDKRGTFLLVEADTDGDGRLDFQIKVFCEGRLQAGDFIL